MSESVTPLRLVFAGTPEFAAVHLQALIDSPHQVVAVYTQPDRPAGRGKKLTASPVKHLALATSIPVYQPTSLRDSVAQKQLAELQPDALVVVAYGLLLPQAVLDIPRFGCINVHASLLPRWRGAAPIQRAIEAGDSSSGVTIMQMDAGLDTGPTLAISELPVAAGMTGGELHDALLRKGPDALKAVLDSLPEKLANASTQEEAPSCYARKIEKAEAELDWAQDANTLHRKILAFNPFPVCWTQLQDKRLKVWAAELSLTSAAGLPGEIIACDSAGITVACGIDTLRLTELQLPGGKPLMVSQLLLSKSEMFAVGERLGV